MYYGRSVLRQRSGNFFLSHMYITVTIRSCVSHSPIPAVLLHWLRGRKSVRKSKTHSQSSPNSCVVSRGCPWQSRLFRKRVQSSEILPCSLQHHGVARSREKCWPNLLKTTNRIASTHVTLPRLLSCLP